MPASKRAILTLSVLAAAAITEFRAISHTGTVPASGEAALGFSTTDAASGEMVAADMLGTTIATAGAAIVQGALVQVGTSGKVITKDAGIAVGRALQAASADGDNIEIFLIPN